jgi:hypothetical protein
MDSRFRRFVLDANETAPRADAATPFAGARETSSLTMMRSRTRRRVLSSAQAVPVFVIEPY